jgi:hypothetical protein
VLLGMEVKNCRDRSGPVETQDRSTDQHRHQKHQSSNKSPLFSWLLATHGEAQTKALCHPQYDSFSDMKEESLCCFVKLLIRFRHSHTGRQSLSNTSRTHTLLTTSYFSTQPSIVTTYRTSHPPALCQIMSSTCPKQGRS